MSTTDLNLAMRISADVSRLMGGLSKGEGGLRKFGNAAKGELAALGRYAGSVEGKLAQLGLGVSAAAATMQSARLDKDLKQLQLTAGATAAEADKLRKSWMDAQIATGVSVDELKGASSVLVASGYDIDQVTGSVKSMAETIAIAGGSAETMARGASVIANMFKIDLGDQKEALGLFELMIVAGREGNAEMENLSDIFARVGGNAKQAGLELNQAAALIETLSLTEQNPERLATLTDSTLRVFTNANYMKSASKATGIRFFDKDGSRRDALDVIKDIKVQYDKLDTDAKRFKFVDAAFGKTDLDTQRGLKALLDDGSMGKLDEILVNIENSSGTIARDLPDAIGNAVDQTGRLKGAMREAADGFAKPINDAVSEAIKFGLDSKNNGGLGLDGTDIMVGGALGAAGLFGAARYGGKAIQGLAGKFGSTAAGVATGKALEEAAGVQPVFVVNMPDGFGGKLGTAEKLAETAGDLAGPKTFSKLKTTLALLGGAPLAALPSFGAGAMATAGAAVAGAGAAGYGVGTLINDYLIDGTALGDAIGEAVAHAISPFSESARSAIAANKASSELTIRIEGDQKARVTQLKPQDDLEMRVLTGRTGAGG